MGDHPYILQAQTYAYFYYLQHGVMPGVRLHLVSSTNVNHVENLAINVDVAQYEKWLELRLAELVAEMQTLESDIMRRIDMSAAMAFPFSQPRPGQIDLMESVSESIKAGKSLMVQAATGLGKTIAIMFPALKDALMRGQKLVYVTPKNSQHTVVEDAVGRFHKQGQALRALTLTAKSKICFLSEPVCTPEHCRYARDYYGKVYESRLADVMAEKGHLNCDILQELEKPGRDPRPEFKTATFKEGIEDISHLSEGMILEGVVSNVTNFGAFVDVGVHQDGLVHISAMTNRFITDPRAIVKAGDIVTVKVVEVDKERRRIGLTMRLVEEKAPPHPKKTEKPTVANPLRAKQQPRLVKKIEPSKKSPEPKNKTLFNTAMADALSKLKRGSE